MTSTRYPVRLGARAPNMSSKILVILIILFFAAILLAGVFYWQTNKAPSPTQKDLTQNETAALPQTTENEIATTTPPFVVKGEISRGNPNKKQVIFTFDGGAGINSAQKILETAKKHDVKTTFFVTGEFSEKNPELIKQMTAEGHEIFNHTYSHPHLTQMTDERIKEEFNKTEQIISDLTGKTTKPFFRPPYGDRNKHILEVAGDLGYESVFWTLDALDWMSDKTEDEVKQRIFNKLLNGAIILMHIGDDITGNILDEVFTKIKNDGYEIVSLSEGIK